METGADRLLLTDSKSSWPSRSKGLSMSPVGYFGVGVPGRTSSTTSTSSMMVFSVGMNGDMREEGGRIVLGNRGMQENKKGRQ